MYILLHSFSGMLNSGMLCCCPAYLTIDYLNLNGDASLYKDHLEKIF